MATGGYERKPFTEEHRKNIGKAKMGNKNPMFGKATWNKGKVGIYSDEYRRKISEGKKKNPTRYWLGKKRPEISTWLKQFSKGRTPWNKGMPNPNFQGENNPCWKGGVTPIYDRIRKLPEYKEWRTLIYERDNYTCQGCGSKKSGTFNAHHINTFIELIAEFLKEYDQFSSFEDTDTLVRLAMKWKPFWDISIGITYCKKCHRKEHSRLKKQERIIL